VKEVCIKVKCHGKHSKGRFELTGFAISTKIISKDFEVLGLVPITFQYSCNVITKDEIFKFNRYFELT